MANSSTVPPKAGRTILKRKAADDNQAAGSKLIKLSPKVTEAPKICQEVDGPEKAVEVGQPKGQATPKKPRKKPRILPKLQQLWDKMNVESQPPQVIAELKEKNELPKDTGIDPEVESNAKKVLEGNRLNVSKDVHETSSSVESISILERINDEASLIEDEHDCVKLPTMFKKRVKKVRVEFIAHDGKKLKN